MTTATNRIRQVLGSLRSAVDAPSDGELLAQFVSGRDEAAFAQLVRMHGPMVLSVCRRVLQHAEDCAYRTADTVVSLLPCALEHMVERGLDPAKFVHIPNGVPVARAFTADDGDLITVANFSSAILDLPFASTANDADRVFSANTPVLPPRGTFVTMFLSPRKARSLSKP